MNALEINEVKKQIFSARNRRHEEPNGHFTTEKYNSQKLNSVDSTNRRINIFDVRTI